MVDDIDSARLYEAAFPFAEDVLALPVEDIDQAAQCLRRPDRGPARPRSSPAPIHPPGPERRGRL